MNVKVNNVCKSAIVHFNMTYLSLAQIEMHSMIGNRNSFQVKISHSVNFQLESESRLQMPVDVIFFKLYLKHKWNSN